MLAIVEDDDLDGRDIYPMDCSKLKKGDVLTIEDLERITSRKYGTTDFQIATLKLRRYIECELLKLGEVVTIIQQRGAMKICLDSEASDVNYLRTKQHVRGIGNDLRRAHGVDPQALTDEQRRDHDRRVVSQSRILQAIASVRRKLQPQPPAIQAPGNEEAKP